MIDDLQKLIYDVLKSHSSENFSKLKGVFTYIEKNTDFPYISIDILGSNNLSNFVEDIRSFDVHISVYDKNTTGCNVLELCNEIGVLLSNIKNFNNKNIIDVVFLSQEITVQNDITLWCGKVKFNIIFKKPLQI